MPFTVLDPALATVVPPLSVATPRVNEGETLLSFEEELNNLLGGRDDIDPARLRRWVNSAYVDLATSLKINDLRSSYGFGTVVNQPLYTVPRQVFSTIGAAIVVLSSQYGGTPLDKITLDAYRSEMQSSGTPTAYFRHSNLLVLHPTPNAVWQVGVECWVRPDYMTEDNHSPILHSEWHEVILLGARKKAFSALKMFDAAMAAENDYVNLIRRRRDSSTDEDDYRLPIARPVRGGSTAGYQFLHGITPPEPE